MVFRMALDPVSRTETLADVVYTQLHDAIANRTLPPGSRLTEAGVAQQLQVSKTPVREALLRLRQVGLIEPDGLRGNRVITRSEQVLRDAYETRQALEAFAVKGAAERGTDGALARIRDLAERSLTAAQDGDIDGYFGLDREFHAAIAEASGNLRIAGLIHDAATLMRALRHVDVPPQAGVLAAAYQHVAIAEALARRDEASAARHMHDHLAAVEELFNDRGQPSA
ncbi:GntR family transcriptional regulator [Actinomadura decatromicini]|uniref:GntR family transcriptional regulator n=2 Tax=Actinomadura decatromicini TaxID=2604572 RepID=A0A5D3FW57_9ACTN|nr:GntR family transcriptional regulator [Actinomadura decatromicini]